MKTLLTSLFLLTLTCFSAKSADIEVVITGVRSATGSLMVAVYDSAANFRLKEVKAVKVQATNTGTVTAKVTDLPPGVYAIAVVHDLNNNGSLDVAGAFKIPTEPYGFSNNPKARFGPPKYEQAAFQINNPGGRLTIALN